MENKKIEALTNAFADIMNYVLNNLANSREKSLVLTKLEEASLWAIKAVSRMEEANYE